MTTWVLLLRALNVGGRNTLAMADLKALLTDLGHGDVRTVLNSGNAVFTSRRTGRAAMVMEIEGGLQERHGLDVQVTLQTKTEVQAALDALPADIAAAPYVVVTFLFDRPAPVEGWVVSPDVLVVGDAVAYIGYAGPMHASKLTNAALEKKLGVSATARTPATLRKLLG